MRRLQSRCRGVRVRVRRTSARRKWACTVTFELAHRRRSGCARIDERGRRDLAAAPVGPCLMSDPGQFRSGSAEGGRGGGKGSRSVPTAAGRRQFICIVHSTVQYSTVRINRRGQNRWESNSGSPSPPSQKKLKYHAPTAITRRNIPCFLRLSAPGAQSGGTAHVCSRDEDGSSIMYLSRYVPEGVGG